MSSTRHYNKKTLLKKSKNVKLTKKNKKSKIHKTRINKLKGGGVYSEEDILNFHTKIDEFKTLDDIDKALEDMNITLLYYKNKTKINNSNIPINSFFDETLIPEIIKLLNNRKDYITIFIKKKSDDVIKPKLHPILEETFLKLKFETFKRDHTRYFQLLGKIGVPNYSINYFEIPGMLTKSKKSIISAFSSIPKQNNTNNDKGDYDYINSIPIINIKDVNIEKLPEDQNQLVITMKSKAELEVYMGAELVEQMNDKSESKYTLKPIKKIDLQKWVNEINTLKNELDSHLKKLSKEKEEIINEIKFSIEFLNKVLKYMKDINNTKKSNTNLVEQLEKKNKEAEKAEQLEAEKKSKKAKLNKIVMEAEMKERTKRYQMENKYRKSQIEISKAKCKKVAREEFKNNFEKCDSPLYLSSLYF